MLYMKNFGLKSSFFYLCISVMLIALFFIFRSKHIEGYPMLKETDPDAKNLGYHADAKKVDKKNFRNTTHIKYQEILQCIWQM